MLFHLLSLSLEDALPDALPEGTGREDVLQLDFLKDIEGVRCVKRGEACVAVLFGRLEDGRSVCVRVEDVRPKLYVLAQEKDTVDTVRREMQREVELRDAEFVEVKSKRFAHFNGWEPADDDPDTQGGSAARKTHHYYEVGYPSLRSWRQAVALRTSDAASRHRAAHETMIDPVTRFLRECKLLAGGWNRVHDARDVEQRISSCDVEVEARMSHIEAVPDRVQMSAYRVLYYDAETLGLDDTKYPLIQLSMVFAVNGDLGEPEKHCVCLGTVAPVEGTTVHACRTEGELLKRVALLVRQKDPDVCVAYNGVNFDNKYLATRADVNRVDEFFHQSRFPMRKSRLRELQLSSSGMGDNKYRYVDVPGRIVLDFFVMFKVEEPSEPSWSLKHFCAKYLPGANKDDMDYREIPGLQAGSDADRARLAKYCVQDSYLLWLLDRARNKVLTVLTFAQVFGVLPEWIFFRGQQVRFVSQVLEAARTYEEVPLLIQTPEEGFVVAGDEGYEGATVNDPLPGYYVDTPVACEDWASLYPSIMMAHNLCHSTHCKSKTGADVVEYVVRPLGLHYERCSPTDGGHGSADGEEGHAALAALLDRKLRAATMNAPARGTTQGGAETAAVTRLTLTKEEWQGVQVPGLTPDVRVSLTSGKGGGSMWRPVGGHTAYFTRARRGIIPTILEHLTGKRKEAKAQVKLYLAKAKEAKDESARHMHLQMANIFDGQQLALKVSANSMYGACGTPPPSAKLPNKDVSEVVTFVGRETMNEVKAILAEHYPQCTVVYGDTDSVMLTFAGATTVDAVAVLAQESSDLITSIFAARGYPRMVLEFEKIFAPYLLMKKKRYVGLKYEPDGKGNMVCKGIDAKGVENQRKDTLPLLKAIQNDVFDKLMHDRDPVAARDAMEAHLTRLVRNEVPMEMLTMSKGLKSEYKDASTQVQCCVNEKRRQREAGSEVEVGDRVSYVIVKGAKGSKKTELAEDPDYVKRHGLPLNNLFYFTHNIKNSMMSVFKPISQVSVERLFERIEAELKRENVGGSSLRDMAAAAAAAAAAGGGGGGGTATSSSIRSLPVHVPRPPPPPPPKRKKKA